MMVHPQTAWCDSIDDILSVMRNRDILTHCFHAKDCGILDPSGKIRDSVREALERGVTFDVGHGSASFSWDICQRALRQNFRPQTISTDLHVYSVRGPVYDLATTACKFLHLGLALDEVVRMVTAAPAQALGLSDKAGTLKVGAWGDAVVFDLQDGNFEFWDACGQVQIGRQRLVPTVIVRAGHVYRRGNDANHS
jgi:dihydroorotase